MSIMKGDLADESWLDLHSFPATGDLAGHLTAAAIDTRILPVFGLGYRYLTA